eukprot:14330271-Alexandrium_andersonii.AAC.1
MSAGGDAQHHMLCHAMKTSIAARNGQDALTGSAASGRVQNVNPAAERQGASSRGGLPWCDRGSRRAAFAAS